MISQDLDIGNYPLESGSNFYRVEQYIECDTSVTALTQRQLGHERLLTAAAPVTYSAGWRSR